MDRQTRLLLGGTLILGGAGAIAYSWIQGQRSQSIAGLSAQIVERPPAGQTGIVHVAVTWTNQAKIPVTYGVQGAVEQAPPIGPSGLIGGRMFTTQDVAVQAAEAFERGDMATVSRLVNDPRNRVHVVRVQPGKQGKADFYARPRVVVGERFLFWIRPSPPSGKLLVQDEPLRPVSELPPAETWVSITS